MMIGARKRARSETTSDPTLDEFCRRCARKLGCSISAEELQRIVSRCEANWIRSVQDLRQGGLDAKELTYIEVPLRLAKQMLADCSAGSANDKQPDASSRGTEVLSVSSPLFSSSSPEVVETGIKDEGCKTPCGDEVQPVKLEFPMKSQDDEEEVAICTPDPERQPAKVSPSSSGSGSPRRTMSPGIASRLRRKLRLVRKQTRKTPVHRRTPERRELKRSFEEVEASVTGDKSDIPHVDTVPVKPQTVPKKTRGRKPKKKNAPNHKPKKGKRTWSDEPLLVSL